MQKLSIGVHKSELGKGFGAALGPMPRWGVGVGVGHGVRKPSGELRDCNNFRIWKGA